MVMHTYQSNSLRRVGHCLVFEHSLNVEQERQFTYKHNI